MIFFFLSFWRKPELCKSLLSWMVNKRMIWFSLRTFKASNCWSRWSSSNTPSSICSDGSSHAGCTALAAQAGVLVRGRLVVLPRGRLSAVVPAADKPLSCRWKCACARVANCDVVSSCGQPHLEPPVTPQTSVQLTQSGTFTKHKQHVGEGRRK